MRSDACYARTRVMGVRHIKMNIVIITISILLLVVGLFLGDTLPKKYRSRSCEGKTWRSKFPTTSKQEIREFLIFFVDAFALSEKDKLKLSPGDELLEIYKAIYPNKWQADSMEFETLDHDLKIKYGLSLEKIWHEKLTLGELFIGVKNA